MLVSIEWFVGLMLFVCYFKGMMVMFVGEIFVCNVVGLLNGFE